MKTLLMLVSLFLAQAAWADQFAQDIQVTNLGAFNGQSVTLFVVNAGTAVTASSGQVFPITAVMGRSATVTVSGGTATVPAFSYVPSIQTPLFRTVFVNRTPNYVLVAVHGPNEKPWVGNPVDLTKCPAEAPGASANPNCITGQLPSFPVHQIPLETAQSGTIQF
jgi:hypothetical protein